MKFQRCLYLQKDMANSQRYLLNFSLRKMNEDIFLLFYLNCSKVLVVVSRKWKQGILYTLRVLLFLFTRYTEYPQFYYSYLQGILHTLSSVILIYKVCCKPWVIFFLFTRYTVYTELYYSYLQGILYTLSSILLIYKVSVYTEFCYSYLQGML